MANQFYAHSRDNEPLETWEPLERHLREVAELTAEFAGKFDSAEAGYLAGLWHDLGKYHALFQEHIRGIFHKFGHAIFGALLALRCTKPEDPRVGRALQLIIAGHHGGLADEGELLKKLRGGSADLASLLPNVPAEISCRELPAPPDRIRDLLRPSGQRTDSTSRSYELWIRFLFSALVDADSLATERFLRGDVRSRLLARRDDLSELERRLDRHLEELQSAAALPVDRIRAQVLQECRDRAETRPGFFSLTVPTGGGKTLSSMAFALKHALAHGLHRVVVAIPFTSIIEQNAEVYARALGSDNVLVHHSNLDPDSETPLARAAAENWDSPVVVSTTVQLFESLFANRRSACRKLHNLARSVIVLDEAQNLPRERLAPILDVLKILVDIFDCTVVFTTATQPALRKREAFKDGIPGITEIIGDPSSLAQQLRRYRVRWPVSDQPTIWPVLAAEICREQQVLVIVHRRQDAQDLAILVPEEGRFHLSALVCPAHRTERIAAIKRRLREGGPCRVIATQVVEAGVDISFPVVYRAAGGLDALVQAGGRCNRHGELVCGELRIFVAPTTPPKGVLCDGLNATLQLRNFERDLDDITDPTLVLDYFQLLYQGGSKDIDGINTHREQRGFKKVASLFRMIDDDWQQAVLIPWKEGAARIERLRNEEPSRSLLRGLQPYSLNIPRREALRLLNEGVLETVGTLGHLALVGAADLYHSDFGFQFKAGGLGIDPANLIA